MIIASYREIIVKLSCYFAEVCDGEFNKKHMGDVFFIAFLFMQINVENFV